jgi:hypothetical protein
MVANIMSYPDLHEIVIDGKKYIDLFLLEDKISSIYPFKQHTLRRLARSKRIPYRRTGISPKDWFYLPDVKHAIKRLLDSNK